MADDLWTLNIGDGPAVATAIHDGHAVRPELAGLFAVGDAGRFREEDPYTGEWTSIAPTRIVALRSRFEVDLNRPREKAVYRVPADAWGIRVWKTALPPEAAERSLEEYDGFYRMLQTLYSDLLRKHGRLLVFDLHSYNHRREGADAPPAGGEGNPQVNIGTGTMIDDRWRPVIQRFIRELSSYGFPGGALDVRENVKFRGGEMARWSHQRFPDNVCVLSVEFKKFFMDEWTGRPDESMVAAIGDALRPAAGAAVEELRRL